MYIQKTKKQKVENFHSGQKDTNKLLLKISTPNQAQK